LMAAGILNIGDIIHAQAGLVRVNFGPGVFFFPLFMCTSSPASRKPIAPPLTARRRVRKSSRFPCGLFRACHLRCSSIAEVRSHDFDFGAASIFFFGGWLSPVSMAGWRRIPGLAQPSFFLLAPKVFLLIMCRVFCGSDRELFPRYRYDQSQRPWAEVAEFRSLCSASWSRRHGCMACSSLEGGTRMHVFADLHSKAFLLGKMVWQGLWVHLEEHVQTRSRSTTPEEKAPQRQRFRWAALIRADYPQR